MTTGEKVYTGIVLAFVELIVVSLGVIHFMIPPEAENPSSMKFVMFFLGFYIVTFCATVSINIVKQELLIIPTIVQSCWLLPTLYGIPIGIMGFYLLWKKYKTKAGSKPAVVQEEDSAGADKNMTTVERVYTGIVLANAGFIFVMLGVIHFMILPETETPSSMKFLMFILGFFLVTFCVTVTINIVKRELLILPTILQSCLHFPLGIMGFYLLWKKYKTKVVRQQTASQYGESTGATSPPVS